MSFTLSEGRQSETRAGGESVNMGNCSNLSPSDVCVGSDGEKTNKKTTSLRSFLSLLRKYFD